MDDSMSFRETVRVEAAGDENCGHDWTYEAKQYQSYPPQYRKICSECGRIEWEQSKRVDTGPSFDDVYEAHHSDI